MQMMEVVFVPLVSRLGSYLECEWVSLLWSFHVSWENIAKFFFDYAVAKR
jgi:hypothetical protein